MWLLNGDNNRVADVNTSSSKGRAAFNPVPHCSAVAGFWFPRNPKVSNVVLPFWDHFRMRLRGKKNKGHNVKVVRFASSARLKEHKSRLSTCYSLEKL